MADNCRQHDNDPDTQHKAAQSRRPRNEAKESEAASVLLQTSGETIAQRSESVD